MLIPFSPHPPSPPALCNCGYGGFCVISAPTSRVPAATAHNAIAAAMNEPAAALGGSSRASRPPMTSFQRLLGGFPPANSAAFPPQMTHHQRSALHAPQHGQRPIAGVVGVLVGHDGFVGSTVAAADLIGGEEAAQAVFIKQGALGVGIVLEQEGAEGGFGVHTAYSGLVSCICEG